MIVSAIIGARKIFQRMTTYSKYTVAMTFRIAFTFGLLTVLYDWCAPHRTEVYLPGRGFVIRFWGPACSLCCAIGACYVA